MDDLKERWGRDSVHAYGKVDSTNEIARELAEDDAPAGTLVVCREQSAGRGRAGHSWYSPADAGLYLSMVLRPSELSHPAMISILGGLGIVESLDRGFNGLRPGLKWPNDIVADGMKLGGVLAEASWLDRRPLHLVVGVGLNVRPLGKGAPDELEGRATAMETVLGEPVALLDVADRVIEGLEAWLPRAPTSLGADLLDRVDRYDWLRDRRVRLTPPGAEVGQPGTCVGIAPDGALLFRPDQGALRRVTDGVVDPWGEMSTTERGDAT